MAIRVVITDAKGKAIKRITAKDGKDVVTLVTVARDRKMAA
jgi:hypothetical protein